MSEYDDLIESGNEYLVKDEYDLAIADYTKAIELEPNDSKAYFIRGNAYFKKGEDDQAIADYTKAIELEPNDSNVYFMRGFTYDEKGEHDLAIADYTKVIELEPNNLIADINKVLEKILGSENDIVFWKKSIQELNRFSHFCIRLIVKFRVNGFDSFEYQKLIRSVYTLWNSLRCRKTDTKIYQYTSQTVLNKMKETRSLRLTPAGYQNDPEEGFIFYNYLITMLKKNGKRIIEVIEQINKEIDNESIAFIRSFTTDGDSLKMWNSSYGENGKGIAIGISPQKLNKGYGISDFKKKEMIELNTIEFSKETQSKKSSGFLEIEKTGLYRILYLNNKNKNKELKDIRDALLQIPKEDLKNKKRKEVLIPLLSELFTSITHLIKDSAYEHEDEYRLMHIGSIEGDKDYIKKSVEPDDLNIDTGIYINTGPILFDDPIDKEIIYFGPKVDTVTVLKTKHIFEYEELFADIRKSEKQYR